MISIEELKQKYPDVRDIKPYGFCVVVPGVEFDPDWEFQLEDQGYKVYLCELDRKPVALITCVKKDHVEEGEKTVYVPPPPEESQRHLPPVTPPTPSPPIGGRGSYSKAGHKIVSWAQNELDRLKEEWPRARGGIDEKAEELTKSFPGRTASAIKQRYLKLLNTSKTSQKEEKPTLKGTHSRRAPKGFYWSEEETERLVSLWNQNLRLSDIAKALPTRSAKSIRSTIDRLQKAGTLQKRKAGRHRRKVAVEEVQNSHKVDKVTETSPTAPSELKDLTEIVAGLMMIVDKLGCQVIMQTLEIKETKNQDFKIPFAIWDAYADAMLEEDKQNRDRFREKVRKLLEAYS